MPSIQPVGLDFLETADYVLSTDVDMPATPAEVWDVLVDNSSWRAWFDGCRAIESSVPVWSEPGETRTITVGVMRLEEVAVAIDEPDRWAMCLTKSSVPLATRMLEMLDVRDTSREGEDRVQVQWTAAIDMPAYLRPLRRLLHSRLTNTWGRSLESLYDEVTARR